MNFLKIGSKKNDTKKETKTEGKEKTEIRDSNEDSDHTISIKRSDCLAHDLNNVYSNIDISKLVANSHSRSKSINEVRNEEDHGKIQIHRSDGVTHDLINVYKAISDSSGVTMRLKKVSSLGTAKMAEQISNASLPSMDKSFFPKNVRIVHMSDTHNFLKKSYKISPFLPHGNILVHSGDFTNHGTEEEFKQFNGWLSSVASIYHYRIIVLGSRDVKVFGNDFDAMKKLLSHATHVLCHSEATVLGIRFYGCPWNWGHKINYTIRPSAPSSTTGRFNDIPDGVQVLITHGPAFGRLDATTAAETRENWGSRELADALRRVRPGLHLHGHVKDSRGILPAFGNTPLTLNSSMCDKDCTVLYACPQVVRASRVMEFDESGSNSAKDLKWTFRLDNLEG